MQHGLLAAHCAADALRSRRSQRYNPSMLDQERLWRDLMALPPEAQRMVTDYIAELHRRYAQAPAGEATDLCNEPFIGLWRDREDLEDFVKRAKTYE